MVGLCGKVVEPARCLHHGELDSVVPERGHGPPRFGSSTRRNRRHQGLEQRPRHQTLHPKHPLQLGAGPPSSDPKPCTNDRAAIYLSAGVVGAGVPVQALVGLIDDRVLQDSTWRCRRKPIACSRPVQSHWPASNQRRETPGSRTASNPSRSPPGQATGRARARAWTPSSRPVSASAMTLMPPRCLGWLGLGARRSSEATGAHSETLGPPGSPGQGHLVVLVPALPGAAANIRFGVNEKLAATITPVATNSPPPTAIAPATEAANPTHIATMPAVTSP